MPKDSLEGDLAALLNGYSLENGSNTPDFILARYLLQCLGAYNTAVTDRGQWYGRLDVPGQGSLPFSQAMKPLEIPLDHEPQDIEVHWYVSTACQHERHSECRRTCKFCMAECVCPYCDHSVLGETDT